jgi:hypothetical protein
LLTEAGVIMKIKLKFGLLLVLLGNMAVAQNASSILPVTSISSDTAFQKDLLDVAYAVIPAKYRTFKSNKPPKKQKKKKIYFSLLPFASLNSYGGQGLVTSTNAGFYLGDKKSTYLSNANFIPYWNLSQRFGLPLLTSIWTENNGWNFLGDTRFLVYPQYTWGLGHRHGEKDKLFVNYSYIRFSNNALKRITSYFFGGIGYHLDQHINIRTDSISLAAFTGYSYGTAMHKNSTSSGVTFNLLYDTRNNPFNPLPGTYANIKYSVNPTFLGSNNNWHSIYIDVRKYLNLNPSKCPQQNLLALWSYYWTALSKGVPYFDLPSIGWDTYQRSGRGFDSNRYRGQSLFYLEAEYRRDITNNGLLGFVVFANANSVSSASTLLFTAWRPAVGTGLRIKFNKTSGTNMALDFAFSKEYFGFQVNLGEAF